MVYYNENREDESRMYVLAHETYTIRNERSYLTRKQTLTKTIMTKKILPTADRKINESIVAYKRSNHAVFAIQSSAFMKIAVIEISMLFFRCSSVTCFPTLYSAVNPLNSYEKI